MIYRLSDEGAKELLHECTDHFKKVMLAKGGKGGRGNRALKTNNHEYEKGFPGEKNHLEFDMNTIADIGLVGQPNAGKSSFLACVSRSSPKIGAYPFTTLSPNIGIMMLDEKPISIADVPGLIEGAHLNIGLGHEFLKHVRKNRRLILVLDVSSVNPIHDANSVMKELEFYQKGLSEKIFLLVANKIDRLFEPNLVIKQLELEFPHFPIIPFSAKYKLGLGNFRSFIESLIN